MTKTLKELFEVYRPKSPDEQKFVDKHVTIKHKDRNGNGDDVFNGNTKAIKRKEERHGYDAGDDEKVYEALKGDQHKIDTNKNGRVDAHDFHLLRKKKKMQEELNLDDLLEEGKVGFKHYTLTSYPREFRTGEGGDITHVAAHPKKMDNLDVEHNKSDKYGDTRHVTVRNNETGEETEHHVYQSGGADSKGKPTVSIRTIGKSKSQQAKHANVIAHYIAGKTKIKESVDDSVMSENTEINALLDEALELLNSLDESTFTEEELALRDELTELSVKKLLNYTAAASSAKNAMKTSTAKLDNRYKGVMRAGDKINKGFSKVHATEEVEDLDESMNDEDDGWYTHNELHGKVSRQDWKKGWRYNKSKAKPYFNSNSKTWHSAIKEEVEDLDELSKKTLGSYTYQAATQLGSRGITTGLKIAADEPTEKNFKKMGNRQKGIATAVKKLTKEDIVNRVINKYVAEDFTPSTLDEQFAEKIEHMSEAYVQTLFSLFDSLNENNKRTMLETVDTQEGINALLDFAIQNKGA